MSVLVSYFAGPNGHSSISCASWTKVLFSTLPTEHPFSISHAFRTVCSLSLNRLSNVKCLRLTPELYDRAGIRTLVTKLLTWYQNLFWYGDGSFDKMNYNNFHTWHPIHAVRITLPLSNDSMTRLLNLMHCMALNRVVSAWSYLTTWSHILRSYSPAVFQNTLWHSGHMYVYGNILTMYIRSISVLGNCKRSGINLTKQALPAFPGPASATSGSGCSGSDIDWNTTRKNGIHIRQAWSEITSFWLEYSLETPTLKMKRSFEKSNVESWWRPDEDHHPDRLALISFHLICVTLTNAYAKPGYDAC